jgi:hypothetical protein
MADVLGTGAVPESADGFQPHVSVAYVNRDQGADAVGEAIETVDEPEAVTADIRRATLIEMHRNYRMYEWRTIAPARLAER